MAKFSADGREIFYASDFVLAATVAPVPDYAAAIGLAKRIAGLLNAAEYMSVDEVITKLSELPPEHK